MKKYILGFMFFVMGLFVLFASVRGLNGNPSVGDINSPNWKDEGPFELSPERGRFALTYSLIEDRSFSFSSDLAKFVTPDLGYINEKYVSLFAPTVSFFVMPGYLLGKIFGISQVGSFYVISIFAMMNGFLIFLIARRLGASSKASLLSSISFLFATPAFAYAVTLYQHHISLFLILVALYALITYRTLWQMPIILFAYVLAITVDYPNLFIMSPLAVAAFFKAFTKTEKKFTINVSINPLVVFTVIPAILPMLFFAWFNYNSYGNPFTLSGSLQTVAQIDANGEPVFDYELISTEDDASENTTDSVAAFFNSRNLLNGLYIHTLSPDRGFVWYAPLVFFGILGMMSLYRRNPYEVSLLGSISLMTILLYSMWGDPWGGWAFGSRYLIPLYAMSSIFIAEFLTQKRNALYSIIFYIVFVYSIIVNTLGALTTNAVPPKIQAEYLSNITKRIEKYSYGRNWDMLIDGDGTKSYVYNTYAKGIISPFEYYSSIVIFIIAVATGILMSPNFEAQKAAVVKKKSKKK